MIVITLLIAVLTAVMTVWILLKNDMSALQKHDDDMKAEHKVMIRNQVVILNKVYENGRKLDKILKYIEDNERRYTADMRNE